MNKYKLTINKSWEIYASNEEEAMQNLMETIERNNETVETHFFSNIECKEVKNDK